MDDTSLTEWSASMKRPTEQTQPGTLLAVLILLIVVAELRSQSTSPQRLFSGTARPATRGAATTNRNPCRRFRGKTRAVTLCPGAVAIVIST